MEDTKDEKNLPDRLPEKPLIEKKGIIGFRHQKIAELVSRGVDLPLVAEEVGITVRSLYRLLETRPEIIQEAYRLIKERLKQSELLMADLHRNALEKLQEHLNSGDLAAEEKAITKILAMTKPPKEGDAKTVINQFFSDIGQSTVIKEERKETLDEIILRKRRERGLPND